jgi:hypothetical protein
MGEVSLSLRKKPLCYWQKTEETQMIEQESISSLVQTKEDNTKLVGAFVPG